MDYYVKELSNKHAVLMAADGHQLAEFTTVDEAVCACHVDCRVSPLYVETHYSYLESGPNDFEASFLQHLH